MSNAEGTMEQEIVTEENLPQAQQSPEIKLKKTFQAPKISTEKIKAGIKNFKRPKLITLVILFVTLVIISIGLNLLSKKNAEEITPPPAFQNSSQPESSPDPNAQNISARVKIYNTKLDALMDFSKKLQKPIVDLDIEFK